MISDLHDRETLAKNVDIWMHLQKIFNAAVTLLERRSLRQVNSVDPVSHCHEVSDSAELILINYEFLREDLHYLNNLLVISRNMLAIKETAQEICAAVQFDQAVHQMIILCVNVTSKGYDGENVDEARRGKLNEITELCECCLSALSPELAILTFHFRQEALGYMPTAHT